MLEISSTHQHDLEQASAAFRDAAELLAELRGQLLTKGFSVEGAESMCETFLLAGLEQ